MFSRRAFLASLFAAPFLPKVAAPPAVVYHPRRDPQGFSGVFFDGKPVVFDSHSMGARIYYLAQRGVWIIGMLLLLGAGPALAGPISPNNSWIPLPAPTLEANKSEDCATCAAVWLLPPGVEQIVGGFGFENWPAEAEVFTRQTDYPYGILHYDGLSFTYDNGQGFASNSWQGTYQKLYRYIDPAYTRYWLAIEDLPSPWVFDWNDYGQVATFANPPTNIPTPPVGALLLLGFWAWRRR